MKKDYYFLRYNGCKFGETELFGRGLIKAPRNGITLIIGDNGSGKSTLLKKIFYNYNANSTLICQENDGVFKELTIKENLSMFQSHISDKFIREELKKYDLLEILDKNPSKLSGGESRLINILRGLWSEKEIILLDEPTNDLDYRIVDKIIKIINDYKSTKTFIIVTHDERLDGISDTIYEINSLKISNINYNYKSGDLIELTDDNRTKLNSKLLDKVINKDAIFIGLLCIITIFSLLFYCFFIEKTDITIERISDGQIEICNSLYSDKKDLITKGFLPTSILISNNENVDKAIFNTNVDAGYSLGLDIETTDKYEVYNIYFLDLKQSMMFSVVETYVQDILQEKEDCMVDTSDIFVLHDYYGKESKKIYFGKKEYHDTYNYLKKMYDDLENIFLVIKLKDSYTYNDFITSPELQELFEGNYFIRSNETINVVEQMLVLNGIKDILTKWGVIVFIMSIVVLYYIYLSLKYYKRTFQILINYGFEKNDVISAVIPRFIKVKKIVMIIILNLIAMAAIYWNNKSQGFMLWDIVIPLLYVINIIILVFVYYSKVRKSIQKIDNIEGEF